MHRTIFITENKLLTFSGLTKKTFSSENYITNIPYFEFLAFILYIFKNIEKFLYCILKSYRLRFEKENVT